MMADIPTAPVQVRPVAYEVSCLPVGHPDRPEFTLRVECRNNDTWCVSRGVGCYDQHGHHCVEPMPSERDDDWMARYYHRLPEAIELAMRLAPAMKSAGVTVAEVVEQ